MNLLEVCDCRVEFDGAPVVCDVSFSVEAGQWLMLVGPNGAGKSTLVGAIAQGVPYRGRVSLCGEDARSLSARALAGRVGVLSQNRLSDCGFSVEEIVRLGGYARSRGFFRRTPEDEEARVTEAMRAAGLEEMRTRPLSTLSGGEAQRVFLAQAFAQNPQILILDEPTNHLDLVYQRQIFSMIGDWLRAGPRAVISVVHDLSLARMYGSHALLLHNGHKMAFGSPAQALSRKNLEAVYGLDVYGWMQNLFKVWNQ